MKFQQYMQKKSPAKINENQGWQPLNESEPDVMAMVKSFVSYGKGLAFLPKYQEVYARFGTQGKALTKVKVLMQADAKRDQQKEAADK